MKTSEYSQKLQQMTDLVRFFNQKGWSPATSTNYSFLHPDKERVIVISKSGIDKAHFSENDWMWVNRKGVPEKDFKACKPSAETGIHTMLYETEKPSAIVHSHSISDTVLSRKHALKAGIIIKNFEILKAFAGVTTHEQELFVPIFANSQNIPNLSNKIRTVIGQQEKIYGFLIESHGLYTWGNSVAEAKRHMEAFQFLFECELRLSWLENK